METLQSKTDAQGHFVGTIDFLDFFSIESQCGAKTFISSKTYAFQKKNIVFIIGFTTEMEFSILCAKALK